MSMPGEGSYKTSAPGIGSSVAEVSKEALNDKVPELLVRKS